MTELIEKFLFETSGQSFTDDFKKYLEEYSSEVNVWENPIFFTFMFLGSILTLPYTGIMTRHDIKEIVIIKTNDVHYMSCIVPQQDGVPRLVIRAINMYPAQHGHYMTISDGVIRCIVNLLNIHYVDALRFDIDYKIAAFTGDQQNKQCVELVSSNNEYLKQQLNSITMDNFFNKELQQTTSILKDQHIPSILKVADQPEKAYEEFSNHLVNMINSNTNQAKSHVYSLITNMYKKYKDADDVLSLLHSNSAANGFVSGYFVLNSQKQYGLKCKLFDLQMKKNPVLQIVPDSRVTELLDANVPIIIGGVNQHSDNLFFHPTYYDFISSTMNDAKQAIVVITGFAAQTHTPVPYINEIPINQGIVEKLANNYATLYYMDKTKVEKLLAHEYECAMKKHGSSINTLSRNLLGQIMSCLFHTDAKAYKFTHQHDELKNTVQTFVFKALNAKIWLAINIKTGSTISPEVEKYFSNDMIPTLSTKSHKLNLLLHIDIFKGHIYARSQQFTSTSSLVTYSGVQYKIKEVNSFDLIRLVTEQSKIPDFSNYINARLRDRSNLFRAPSEFQAFLKGILQKNTIMLSKLSNSQNIFAFIKNDPTAIKNTNKLLSYSLAETVDQQPQEDIIIINTNTVKERNDLINEIYAYCKNKLAFSSFKGTIGVVGLAFESLSHYVIRSGLVKKISINNPSSDNNLASTSKSFQENSICLTRRKKRGNHRECIDLHELKNVNDNGALKINQHNFIDSKISENDGKRKHIPESSIIEKTEQEMQTKIAHNSHKQFKQIEYLNGLCNNINMGIVGKNIMSAILNGDYKSLETNAMVMAGNHLLSSLSNGMKKTAAQLAKKEKMYAAAVDVVAPFIERATAAFSIYDLVETSLSETALTADQQINLSTDSVFISGDISGVAAYFAERIGLRIAAGFATAGTVLSTVGTILIIGTEVYNAIRGVDKLEHELHLTENEKFIQGLRSFISLGPSEYLKEIIDLKERNNLLVENATKLLAKLPQYSSYVFPMQKLTGNKWQNLKNNTIIMQKQIFPQNNIRSIPVVPHGYELLCYSGVEILETEWSPSINRALGFTLKLPISPAPELRYVCKNSIGVRIKQKRRAMLIDLGEGVDFAIAFENMPTTFLIGNGNKTLVGGNRDDYFIFNGNETYGDINGRCGKNTVDMQNFAHSARSLIIKAFFNFSQIIYDKKNLIVKNIHKYFGRKDKPDVFYPDCSTEFINCHAADDDEDVAFISDQDCTMNKTINLTILINGNTRIINSARYGKVVYIITKNSKNVTVTLDYNVSAMLNVFVFNFSFIQLVNMEKFSQSNCLFLNISDGFHSANLYIKNFPFNLQSAFSFNNGVEMQLIDKSYGHIITQAPLSDILTVYPQVAEELGLILIVRKLFDNFTIVIGHSNKRNLSSNKLHNANVIYNDPFNQTHMIGGNAETICVITSGYEKLYNINNFPIAPVFIYCHNLNYRMTLDFGKLARQVKRDLNRTLKINLEKDTHNNHSVVLNLYALQNEPKFFTISPTLICSITLVNLLLAEAYKMLDIKKNGMLEIQFDSDVFQRIQIKLIAKPLYFSHTAHTIVICADHVEPESEIIVNQTMKAFAFLQFENTLVVTNHQEILQAAYQEEYKLIRNSSDSSCTMIFKHFYSEYVLQTLAVTFNDVIIKLSDVTDGNYQVHIFKNSEGIIKSYDNNE